MSLSSRDRQTLSRIEEGLACSDPRFAARLSAFSRLAEGEEMPARERIRPRRQRTGPRSGTRWWLRWTGGAWILWLMITAAMITVAIVLSHSSGQAPGCPRQQALGCLQRSPPTAPPASGGHGGSTGYGGGDPSRGPGGG